MLNLVALSLLNANKNLLFLLLLNHFLHILKLLQPLQLSPDSEPSYTNSSDGLDIYDHIGVDSRALNNGGNQSGHRKLAQDQFQHVNLAPQIHVGEWEDMYGR